MPSIAIEINNLTVTYTKGLLRKSGRGVNDLSLSVEEGQLFGFLGPNGAGKTTTIKVLNNLLRPTDGSVSIFGADVQKTKARQQIGFMPENPYFYEHLTAIETLEFYGACFKLDQEHVRLKVIPELLDQVGLKDISGVRVGEFSKGMRQRLGFAQVLINNPRLIILDEPLSGLDPLGRADLMGNIRRLHQEGKTVFLSSHILSDIEGVCSHVALLNKGSLLKTGPISEIIHNTGRGADITVSGNIDSSALPDGITAAANGPAGTVIRTENQDQTDSVIDTLRNNGLSILSTVPAKSTLEDFFIQHIADKDNV